jgi:hypothetical protein
MIIKYAILLTVVLVLAVIFMRAFLPARHLPGNRARHLRIRLHLRLHPGKGFAHVFSLWLRWSRFAVLRRSGQIRSALPAGRGLRQPSRARHPARSRPGGRPVTPPPDDHEPGRRLPDYVIVVAASDWITDRYPAAAVSLTQALKSERNCRRDPEPDLEAEP